VREATQRERAVEGRNAEGLTEKVILSSLSPEAPFKSKITKLLIVLGIVFLIGLLKDFFNPQSNSTIPLTKINQLTAASLPLQTDSAFTDGAEQEKARLLEAVEQSLIEVVEPKGIAAKIKGRIKN
jgi:hypothetical protein